MESSTWARFTFIFAMFLGSIYILLPTVLQEDPEAAAAEKTQQVSAPARVDDGFVRLEAVEGDADALTEVLTTRLKVAEVAIDGIKRDGSDILVLPGLGTEEGDIIRFTRRKGRVSLHLPAVVLDSMEVALAEPLAEGVALDLSKLSVGVAPAFTAAGVPVQPWSQALPALARRTVPVSLPSLASSASFTQQGQGVRAQISPPLPAGASFAFLAIDRRLYGIVFPDGTVVQVGRPLSAGDLPFELDPDGHALLVSGPLPGSISRVEDSVPSTEDSPEAAPKAHSKLPPWLAGILPNTRMNLGLDLQGGIDLTLQVELGEAVASQVSRDLAYFKAQAERDGIVYTSATTGRVDPVIIIETDLPLSDLQTFFRTGGLLDYIYDSSDGKVHRFRLKDDRISAVKKQAVEQVLETLRKRVDATGVKEPSIVKKGGGRINVQLPGKVDLQAAIDAIGTTAILEFRLVDEDFDESILEKIIEAARDALPPKQFEDDERLNEWLWKTRRLNEDRIVQWHYEETPDGMVRTYPQPLKRAIMLTGNDVNNATVGWNQNQQPYVSLDLKPRGGKIFCDVTGENVGKRFGIILDGQIRSAPNIRERICGGRASIEMGSDSDALQAANNLALVLRTGSLDAPVSIGEVRTVGSTLGADSIASGTEATIVGSLIVLVFMGGWYRKAGMIANVALVLNVLLVFSALALFGATLTLPGIAGIALTIGMAVDANIIIYERIREELRLGIGARKAVDTGFDKGVVAVLDANITTAIAGVVLFSYGTGPIKGFAVTLLVGIVTTLFTALFVTRTFMDMLTRRSDARLRL